MEICSGVTESQCTEAETASMFHSQVVRGTSLMGLLFICLLLSQSYSQYNLILLMILFSKNLILQKRKDDLQTEGDFLSWESLEEDRWTLYSKAKWVNLDSGLEDPCREKAQINVLLRNEPNSHNDSMKHCKKL